MREREKRYIDRQTGRQIKRYINRYIETEGMSVYAYIHK